MYVHKRACACLRPCTRARRYVRVCVCVYIYIYMYVCIYIYIYTEHLKPRRGNADDSLVMVPPGREFWVS